MYKMENLKSKQTSYMTDTDFENNYKKHIDPIYLEGAFNSHLIKIDGVQVRLTKVTREV